MEARGKINLYLDVINKRKDGYHDLVTVMQSINLCDGITISVADKSSGDSVGVTSNDPRLGQDDSNLVYKAAKLMIKMYDIQTHIHINIEKRIPMGAGLAGGSSDCAAVLKGLNQLFKLGLEKDVLINIGRSLGADVPFCLTEGTALAEGIGDVLTPLTPHPFCRIVVALPENKNGDEVKTPLHISTPQMFSRLKPEDIGANNCRGADKILGAIADGDLRKTAGLFYNVFTPVASCIHPEIPALTDFFIKAGALGASMTGTGSAVFAYFADGETAERVHDELKKTLKYVFITSPHDPNRNRKSERTDL